MRTKTQKLVTLEIALPIAREAAQEAAREVLRVRANPSAVSESDVCFVDASWIENRSALTRYTLWKLEDLGEFPKSVPLGGTDGRPQNRKPGKRVWIRSEVEKWIRDRIAARDRRNAKAATPRRRTGRRLNEKTLLLFCTQNTDPFACGSERTTHRHFC